jgi:Domain of unknown function (DUF1840)
MVQEHAHRILDVLNKNHTRGVITAAEAAHAVQLLEREVALSKLHPEVDSDHANHTHPHHLPDEDESPEMAEKNHIGFAQRAFPLLEMLRTARDSGGDIVWGI